MGEVGIELGSLELGKKNTNSTLLGSEFPSEEDRRWLEEFTLGLTGAAAREALLVDGEEKERRWSSARKENDRNRGSRGVKQSWLYSLGSGGAVGRRRVRTHEAGRRRE